MSKNNRDISIVAVIALLTLTIITLTNFFLSLIARPFTDTDVIIVILNGTVGFCSAVVLVVIAFTWTKNVSNATDTEVKT